MGGLDLSEWAVPELEREPERQKTWVAWTKKKKAHWSTKRATRIKDPNVYGKLNRNEIVTIISAMTGYTKAETRFFYDAFCALIFFELANGRDFYVAHAGMLHTTLRKQRVYPHRFSGEMMSGPLTALITFRQSRFLRNEIKNLPEELKQMLYRRQEKEQQNASQEILEPEDEDFI